MRFRNRDGTPVDPWPFVVVAGTGVLPVLSFGPLYLAALGVALPAAVGTCAAVSAGVVVAAYHRYVRTRRPRVRTEVPPERRLRHILYGGLLLVGVLALLALPLIGREL